MSLSLSKRLQVVVLSTLAAWTMRLWGSTWSIRELSPKDRSPKRVPGGERFIYAYWHEYIISTVGHYRGYPIQALASQSFDGDIITKAMLKMGYPAPARGSSSRGGASGLRDLLRGLKSGYHASPSLWMARAGPGAWPRTAC